MVVVVAHVCVVLCVCGGGTWLRQISNNTCVCIVLVHVAAGRVNALAVFSLRPFTLLAFPALEFRLCCALSNHSLSSLNFFFFSSSIAQFLYTQNQVNLFDPPPETVASIDHAVHVTASLHQRQSVRAFHLASEDDVYPVLVIVGPAASGKRGVMQLLTRGSDVFVHCKSYTTCHTDRDADLGPTSSKYHHVSFDDFQDMVGKGMFLQTFRFRNHLCVAVLFYV